MGRGLRGAVRAGSLRGNALDAYFCGGDAVIVFHLILEQHHATQRQLDRTRKGNLGRHVRNDAQYPGPAGAETAVNGQRRRFLDLPGEFRVSPARLARRFQKPCALVVLKRHAVAGGIGTVDLDGELRARGHCDGLVSLGCRIRKRERLLPDIGRRRDPGVDAEPGAGGCLGHGEGGTQAGTEIAPSPAAGGCKQKHERGPKRQGIVLVGARVRSASFQPLESFRGARPVRFPKR